MRWLVCGRHEAIHKASNAQAHLSPPLSSQLLIDASHWLIKSSTILL